MSMWNVWNKIPSKQSFDTFSTKIRINMSFLKTCQIAKVKFCPDCKLQKFREITYPPAIKCMKVSMDPFAIFIAFNFLSSALHFRQIVVVDWLILALKMEVFGNRLRFPVFLIGSFKLSRSVHGI